MTIFASVTTRLHQAMTRTAVSTRLRHTCAAAIALPLASAIAFAQSPPPPPSPDTANKLVLMINRGLLRSEALSPPVKLSGTAYYTAGVSIRGLIVYVTDSRNVSQSFFCFRTNEGSTPCSGDNPPFTGKNATVFR
jgi:hypothetical protein